MGFYSSRNIGRPSLIQILMATTKGKKTRSGTIWQGFSACWGCQYRLISFTIRLSIPITRTKKSKKLNRRIKPCKFQVLSSPMIIILRAKQPRFLNQNLDQYSTRASCWRALGSQQVSILTNWVLREKDKASSLFIKLMLSSWTTLSFDLQKNLSYKII